VHHYECLPVDLLDGVDKLGDFQARDDGEDDVDGVGLLAVGAIASLAGVHRGPAPSFSVSTWRMASLWPR
jgi:hypothetical protein